MANRSAARSDAEQDGVRARLVHLTAQAEAVILARQDASTGLLPASTAITVHGDYTHAWVRDNVYSILGVWALSLAWRRHDGAQAQRLADRVRALMRGLLSAMMRQSHKVERFKHTLDPLDALHAKYATHSGEVVVGDGDWGHLQLDATALFLLEAAQFSAAGLLLVTSEAEEAFFQNLVHYLARAWRTPDYGIWERGHKRNEGVAEINASSLGLVRAALAAVSGLVLRPGGRPIVVLGDDIAAADQVLQALLPRESASKETDASLLAVVGFPAFAVDDPVLAARTRQEVIDKLQGRYGCKRFLRDGHQTELEDHQRLHYEPGELHRFEGIESEWPLFFTYLLIDAVHRGDAQAAQGYRERLDALMQLRDGQPLLPELYRVPAQAIDAERAEPHSQLRVPNDNLPLVWAQSLHLVGVLLQEGWLAPAELSPLRWLPPRAGAAPDPEVQLLVLAEDPLAQARLAVRGLTVPTAAQAAPLRVIGSGQIVAALANCGRCEELGLGGRPPLPLGSLMSSRLYRAGGDLLLALPAFADRSGGYLALDNRLLLSAVEAELTHLRRHWRSERGLPGQPVLVWPVGSEWLDAPGADALLDFLEAVAAGRVAACRWAGVAGVAAAQPPLPLDGWADGLDLAPPWARGAQPPMAASCDTLGWDEAATRPLTPQRAAALERVRDPAALWRQLERSRNPYEQIDILGQLCALGREAHGEGSVGAPTALLQHLEAVARRAARQRLWGVLRRAAGWLDWHDAGLELAVNRVMVHRKRLALGRAYSEGAVLDRPIPHAAIVDTVRRYGGTDVRVRVLIEEVVCLLGLALQENAAPFQGTLTLRPWSLVTLLTGWLSREHGVTQAEAFEHLLDLSPHALLLRLREVIRRERDLAADLLRGHHLDAGPEAAALTVVQYRADGDPVLDGSDAGDWHAWREMRGAITRVPEGFHARVWELLHHCNGLLIGDQFDIRNRLDSRLLRADSTRSEIGFALLVDDLLHKIQAPDYRQLTIEAVAVLTDLCAANPDLQVDGLFVVDVVIGSAVRLGWQGRLWRDPEAQGPDATLYREQVAEAWQAFYASPPHRVANLISAAARHLLAPESAASPIARERG
jgi:phosphorylase kinase alpha/beta subunit